MMNLVLMAGKGQRFTDAGYTIPKPLLPVADKPMILRAVESMPRADKWIFVIRDDYQKENAVMGALRGVAGDVTIIVAVDSPSQLNSALFAREYLETDEPVFIGACDFGMAYDQAAYEKILAGEMFGAKPDIVSWSFTGQQNLVRNPQAWAWLRQDASGRVNGVSVKIPISDDPLHDFAITGSFTFRSGKYFLELGDELVRRDIKVKNEYYIDSLLGLATERGNLVVSFPIKYIGWGTPADYEENKDCFS